MSGFSRQLPVHDCVYSYRADLSVRAHAIVHRQNNYLLRLDIKDFFPSIGKQDIYHLLAANADRFIPALENPDIELIARLACKGGAITIGAPSSPSISNAIL